MAEPCHGASMNSMNLTRTNQAFTKNRLGSIAAAKREQHFRSLYLQLTKEVILNNIYEPGPHIDEGCQWAAPQGAHHDRPEALGQRPRTRRAAPRSIDSRRSDRDRCLARRGDNFHACILKAYDVHDRRVFVADSFRGIPPIDPQKYPATAHTKEWISLRFLVIIQLNTSAKIFAGCNFSTTKWFFWKGGSRIHSLR